MQPLRGKDGKPREREPAVSPCHPVTLSLSLVTLSLPQGAPTSTTEQKWRYPTQEQNYRENPAFKDYEDMLGHSALNMETEEFLRRTEDAVLSPEERAIEEARWEKLSMAEKMKGPPPAYLNTPGLRKDEESGIGNRQKQESGIGNQESGKRGKKHRESERSRRKTNPNVARLSNPSLARRANDGKRMSDA